MTALLIELDAVMQDFKSAPQIPAEEHSGETGTFQVNDLKARRIMEELRDRQLWPSYQNMLASVNPESFCSSQSLT